jgi:hypothetical protein
VNPWGIIVVALLTLLGFVLGGGVPAVGSWWHRWRMRRTARPAAAAEVPPPECSRFTMVPFNPIQVRRPGRWLAIRSRDTFAVQTTLRLNNPRPCSWTEGLFVARQLFIAPPVKGWTLVFGASLPSPDEDVDRCYRFLRELSQRLGHVQFFQADPLLQHHAWAQVESGRVLRAYAWAGATVWHQGVKTPAEIALGMNCFGYGENPGTDDWVVADHLVANVDKVPQLAQRWSLDPAELDLRFLGHQRGVAGNSAGIA